MLKEDYLMRTIKEMVRAVIKLLFNIDTDTPSADLLEKEEEKETLAQLVAMVEDGKINEAENHIYEITANKEQSKLKIALLFYSYLNEKTDDFLEKNDFSREEIKFGMKQIVSRYGLDHVAALFVPEK